MNNVSRFISGIALLAAALLVIGSAPALAQSGGSKDTQKLQKSVEDSRKSLQDAVDQVKETMQQYNSLIAGDAKKPNSIYKNLSKSADKCDKAADGARKSVESMHKDLEKFYKSWEKELESYQSDSMKEHGRKSLEKVRATFDNYDAALKGASELYSPFIATLHDHVTFMGRDLSPEGLGELKDEAAKLNEDAEALYAKVDEALAASQPGSADDAAPETSEMADEDAATEEGTSDETTGDDTGDAGSDAPGEETPDE
jgi:SMC interacting uncharacterized protein involved in chromosome segregation